MDAPRVFLSHASEDKQRFAIPFATALRAGGLDVWVDEWEMAPGDSIVKKIFTEGIAEASAVVVVLSSISITKQWVQEELDAAVVQRINQESRLIPVVLDNLTADQIPASIRHLLWISAPDPAKVNDAAQEVINAVFGVHKKPPVGPAPPHAAAPDRQVAGLGRIDSLVLKAAGEEAVRDFGERFQTAEFVDGLQLLGVSEASAIESLEVLHQDGYIKLHQTMGTGLASMKTFDLTTFGLEHYLQTYVETYGPMTNEIAAAVANMQQGTDADIAKTTSYPRLIVLHVLRLLASNGLIHLSEPHGPYARFHSVSPKLRRMLSE